MRRALFSILFAGACTDAPGSPDAAGSSVNHLGTARTATVTTTAMLLGRCQICHSMAHVSQQRLTPAQWTATVTKMIGWGAPLNDDEAARVARTLAEQYPPELPDPPLRRIRELK